MNPAPRHEHLPVEADDLAESKPSSKGEKARLRYEEARLRRREIEIKTGKEALASALAKTLVLLPLKGNCKCGMMLTERDKNAKAETYRCPRCGKSGPLAPVAATPIVTH